LRADGKTTPDAGDYSGLPLFCSRSAIVADVPFRQFRHWRDDDWLCCDSRRLRDYSRLQAKTNHTCLEMNNTTWQRLFGFRHAFDDRVTVVLTMAAVGLLVLAPLLIFITTRSASSTAEKRNELWDRYRSWIWLALCILIPILAGAFWTMIAVGTLSVLCYREYARITGLFRERTISFIVVIGILLITFAELDNWYRLFVALFPLTVALVAIGGLIPDQPKGYIQRVGLGVLGFALFGSALGNLGYMANDWNYRPMLLLVILAVELNNIFAYICGHLFGRQKFVPNTSPNKTAGGAVGALVLTTPLVAVIAHFIWTDTALDNPICLIGLGIIVSVVGQFGDLMLSSIKRDLGIKDTAKLIPGHGGLLDRFDSLILVAPAVFHYVNYFVGITESQPQRIFSGF
jgi:phosphatidate cytidylyltransferase